MVFNRFQHCQSMNIEQVKKFASFKPIHLVFSELILQKFVKVHHYQEKPFRRDKVCNTTFRQ